MEKLEALYESKLQLARKEHDAALAAREQQHRQQLAQLQAHTRSLLQALKEEVSAQVADVTSSLERQVCEQKRARLSRAYRVWGMPGESAWPGSMGPSRVH